MVWGAVNGSHCYFYLQTLGAGWKGVKKPWGLSLLGLHCDCSLSINTNHQRKWVDALWKGHEGSVEGAMSDSLMCFWVIVLASQKTLWTQICLLLNVVFLRQGI